MIHNPTSMASRKVGDTIRRLRIDHKMTGSELGKHVGLSQSKISKIEHGLLPMEPKLINLILRKLDAPAQLRKQLVSDIEPKSDKKSVALNFNFVTLKHNYVQLQADHDVYRCFALAGVPSLLQTVAYRRELMRIMGVSNEEAGKRINRMIQRQDMIWEGNQQYVLLMPEIVLYTVITSSAEHIAQLDRIERSLGFDNPKVGILPNEEGIINIMNCTFVLFDDALLVRELGPADVDSTDQSLIRQYQYIFDEISIKSKFNQDAQQLVYKAKNFIRSRL